ncbi:hypothetical protein ACPZ19_51615 [Amycolatopsis lurida]
MAGDVFRRRSNDDHIGPLAEFVALRAEILLRIELQWKLTLALLTTTGAVFGFGFSSPGRMPFLLIVPFSSYVLCTRWVSSKQLIARAGRYILDELDPKVPGGLGYEKWLQQHFRRDISKTRSVLRQLWTSHSIVLFPGLSLLALGAVAIWYFQRDIQLSASVVPWLTAAWIIGLILTVIVINLMRLVERYHRKPFTSSMNAQSVSSERGWKFGEWR